MSPLIEKYKLRPRNVEQNDPTNFTNALILFSTAGRWAVRVYRVVEIVSVFFADNCIYSKVLKAVLQRIVYFAGGGSTSGPDIMIAQDINQSACGDVVRESRLQQ